MDTENVSRPWVIIFGIFVVSVGVIFMVLENISRTKEKPEFNVDTISVGQPELGIEPARFYLVENQWGYGLVQFKDIGLDKKLDKVFCRQLRLAFNPDDFDPRTGFLSSRIFDPNSVFSVWNEWVQRFEKVLQEHDKKLKRQKGLMN